MHAKQYQSRGILNAFFSNDWIHCIFTNQNATVKSQKLAKYAIFSQIVLSTLATIYF